MWAVGPQGRSFALSVAISLIVVKRFTYEGPPGHVVAGHKVFAIFVVCVVRPLLRLLTLMLLQILHQEKGARLSQLLRALLGRPWVPGRYLSTAKYMLSDFKKFVAASWDNLPEAEVSMTV